MDVQAAIEAPRVNSLHPVSSFDNHRAQPGVLEEYTYLDVKINQGFTDADFDDKNPNYRFH